MKRSVLALGAALLAAPGAASARPNIVVNGGFETGNFSGWTQFGNTVQTFVGGVFIVSPTEGLSQGVFGPAAPSGGISQALAVSAGDIVNISFDLFADGTAANSFSADLGSTNLVSLSAFTVYGYQTYTYTNVVVGADNDALSFDFENYPSYWLIDNVQVELVLAQVPMPSAAGLGFASLMGLAGRRRR